MANPMTAIFHVDAIAGGGQSFAARRENNGGKFGTHEKAQVTVPAGATVTTLNIQPGDRRTLSVISQGGGQYQMVPQA